MTDSYPIAVCDPFNPRAEGAQVPDMYSFPSQTAQLRTQFTLSNLAGQSNMDFVVQPNPFNTLAVSIPSPGSGVNPILKPITGVSGGNLFAWSNSSANAPVRGFAEYGLTTADSLADQFSRFRVVGFGWRLRTLAAPLNVQGSIVACQVPSTKEWLNCSLAHQTVEAADDNQPGQLPPPLTDPPSSYMPATGNPTYSLPTTYAAPAYSCSTLLPATFSTNDDVPPTSDDVYQQSFITPTWPQYLDYYELPSSDINGFITEGIVNMPMAYQGTMPNLSTNGGLEVVGRISSPEAFNWHNSSNDPGFFSSTSAGGTSGHKFSTSGKLLLDLEAEVVPQGGNALSMYTNQIVGVCDDEYTFQGGWSTSAVRISGLNSSATGAQFTLDIIMHLEGQPHCGSTSIISGAKFPFYRPMMIEETVAVQAQLPSWRRIAGNVWEHVYANRSFYLDAARGVFGISM